MWEHFFAGNMIEKKNHGTCVIFLRVWKSRVSVDVFAGTEPGIN